MWGPWDGASWGFGMIILAMLFVALIVVGIVLIVRSLPAGRPPDRPSDMNRALEILNERFARGEIDKDEFPERRRILGDGR